MHVSPDSDDFARQYDAGKPQIVHTALIADLETPVSAMLKLADGQPNSFLLESVEGGSIRGRYSFIGLKPDLIRRGPTREPLSPARAVPWNRCGPFSMNRRSICRRTCRRCRPVSSAI